MMVMELERGADGKTGATTLFRAAKLGFDKDEQTIEIESPGIGPLRLTKIEREK